MSVSGREPGNVTSNVSEYDGAHGKVGIGDPVLN